MKASHFGRSIRFRLAFVFVCFLVFFSLIALRLVQLQVFPNSELASLAKKQIEREGKPASFRLPIFDRNGEELAVSIPSSSVFARPRMIQHKKTTARKISRILPGSYEHYYKKLKADRSFVWLKRQVGAEIARKLEKQKLKGIFFESENKRVYPNGDLAAHVVGFTDIDGNGLAGVELTLNKQLTSYTEESMALRDGKGIPSYISKKKEIIGNDRTGVFLTLDRRLQHVVEEGLIQTMETTGAEAAFAIIMDPYTGEVLAMGQRPTFDPNRANRFPVSTHSNRTVSHLFEPGSTMKVIFSAEAIQQGILRENSLIDCNKGKIKVGKNTINEADAHHKFGKIPLADVIRHSSNVGAVKIAQALGSDRVRSCLDRFGLTSRSGINLPGETNSGPRADKYWKPIFLATVGFGQGISATPLQIVSSFAPFANGGFWVRPRILAETSDEDKSSSLDTRRVLSLKTVEKMRKMMVSVTEKGTGITARVPKVKVAGKTGTAQKYVPGKGYRSGKYFSSFVGFLPAHRPELLIGVMVDEPKKDYYGSQVAAPLFKKIAEQSLQYVGRTPKRTVAGVQSLRRKSILHEPKLPPRLARGNEKWAMPDLKGVGLRDSLDIMQKIGHRLRIRGQGYVKKQSPAPGTIISSKSLIRLHLSPDPQTPKAPPAQAKS